MTIDGAPAAISAMLRGNLAFVEANLGDLDAGLAHGLAALRVAARGGSWTRIWAASALAYMHLWRGELAAVRRILEGYELESGDVIATRAAELWGLLLEEEGAATESLSHYQRGATLEDPMPRMNCELGVARTAVAIGELGTAQAALGADRRACRALAGGRVDARGGPRLGRCRRAPAGGCDRAPSSGRSWKQSGLRRRPLASGGGPSRRAIWSS